MKMIPIMHHLLLRFSSCKRDFNYEWMVLRNRMSKQSLRGTTQKRLQYPRQRRNRNRLCLIQGTIAVLKLFFLWALPSLSRTHMILMMEKTPQSDTLFCFGVLKSVLLNQASGLFRFNFLTIFQQQLLYSSGQVPSESQTTISPDEMQTAMTNQCWLGMLTRKISFSQAKQLSVSRWLLMKMSVSEWVKRQARKLLSLWQLLVPSTCFRYSITAEVIELSSHSFSISLFRMSCVMVPAYSAQKVSTLRSSRSRQWSHQVIQRQHSMILLQQYELSLQGRFLSILLSQSSWELNFLKISLDLRSKVVIYW